MFMAFNAPAIGIRNMPLPAMAALAHSCGFAGLDFDIREASDYAGRHSPAAVKDLFASHRLRPATWGLPVDGVQNEWNIDLDELRQLARLASAIGATRCTTWVPSWHDTRAMAENRAYHVARLRPAAQILADNGCVLGLEFLGPLSLLEGHSHAFIRTMPDMLDMAHEIGTGNVGLLVDAWHIYTSGGTWDQLANVPARYIVQVHINDAPKGIAMDELVDVQRCLPLETGRIDLAGFMRTLAKLGYEGPVVTEPFNARLNAVAEINPGAAAAEVAAVMKKLWSLSGLPANI